MSDQSIENFSGYRHGNWVNLRTLIYLRWFAILGQGSAVLVGIQYFDLAIDLGICTVAIGASACVNLFATFVYPEGKRLSEAENAALVIFDLVQLSVLLFVTGGLNNPFSMLMVAPVAVAASVFKGKTTSIIAGLAVVFVTLLLFFFQPLRTDMGFIMRIPLVFMYGNYVAIVISMVFVGLYVSRLTREVNAMSDGLLATQMALAREQKLTDLGGVIAAAAHELGTPLATIKLTSAELIEELSDRVELQEDAELIREQADRCRDILRSMGRAGKDDLHLRKAPVSAVIEEAAEPHQMRGAHIKISKHSALDEADLTAMPQIYRKPEIIHGLRNMIQNAVDFAASTVWIEYGWTQENITLRVMDDGPGYPNWVLGRIGDPSLRRRRTRVDNQRPGYEGMGLGLFIAKTLLERTGATLSFANLSELPRHRRKKGEQTGAIVEISWPRSEIEHTEIITSENIANTY